MTKKNRRNVSRRKRNVSKQNISKRRRNGTMRKKNIKRRKRRTQKAGASEKAIQLEQIKCYVNHPRPEFYNSCLFTGFNDYKLQNKGKSIGEGKFATVYLYKNKKDPGDEIAVKILKKADITTFNAEGILHCYISTFNEACKDGINEGECEGYKYLSEFKGFVNRKNLKGVTATFCNKGDLKEAIKKSITYEDSLIRNIIKGLKYLHKIGVVHRDLAPRNIFLHEEGGEIIPKIADFGLSRIMDKTDKDIPYFKQIKDETLPIPITSPNALKNLKFSAKSDIHSLALLIYSVFTGKNNIFNQPDPEENPTDNNSIKKRNKDTLRAWLKDLYEQFIKQDVVTDPGTNTISMPSLFFDLLLDSSAEPAAVPDEPAAEPAAVSAIPSNFKLIMAKSFAGEYKNIGELEADLDKDVTVTTPDTNTITFTIDGETITITKN